MVYDPRAYDVGAGDGRLVDRSPEDECEGVVRGYSLGSRRLWQTQFRRMSMFRRLANNEHMSRCESEPDAVGYIPDDGRGRDSRHGR